MPWVVPAVAIPLVIGNPGRPAWRQASRAILMDRIAPKISEGCPAQILCPAICCRAGTLIEFAPWMEAFPSTVLKAISSVEAMIPEPTWYQGRVDESGFLDRSTSASLPSPNRQSPLKSATEVRISSLEKRAIRLVSLQKTPHSVKNSTAASNTRSANASSNGTGLSGSYLILYFPINRLRIRKRRSRSKVSSETFSPVSNRSQISRKLFIDNCLLQSIFF
ncbi:hypothetical protein ES703_110289 [subsurface metagenome]